MAAEFCGSLGYHCKMRMTCVAWSSIYVVEEWQDTLGLVRAIYATHQVKWLSADYAEGSCQANNPITVRLEWEA
jgi:hypothetical protein